MGESGSCFPERFLNLCLEVVKKQNKTKKLLRKTHVSEF